MKGQLQRVCEFNLVEILSLSADTPAVVNTMVPLVGRVILLVFT